ncbi:MAG: acetolactate decarboxylase [Vagococcus sp.]
MSEKTLYQHGTLGALMAGLMDGTTTIRHILDKGDLGIGTLHGLDGEVIILNGKAYQGRSDGTLIELTGEELTPYAAVTPFLPDTQFFVETPKTSDTLKTDMLNKAMSDNLFFAVKITGLFDRMHIRIMPKQEKPYKRLVEVSKGQPEFVKEQILGTIVGFYTPSLFQGVAASGFHLHFLSEQADFGGHIIDFKLGSGAVELSHIETLAQHFPIQDDTFTHTTIDYADLASEIEQAE